MTPTIKRGFGDIFLGLFTGVTGVTSAIGLINAILGLVGTCLGLWLLYYRLQAARREYHEGKDE